MLESFGWGLFASSSLLIGALLTIWLPLNRRTLGLVMAFGSGVLILEPFPRPSQRPPG
jgi:ZIP family zinc transporter